MLNFFKRVLDVNEKNLHRYRAIVEKINAQEEVVKKLADSDFKTETEALKKRISEGESLDSLLPYAYALVREAAVRSVGMRHFDVQLLAGIALHEGKIIEQKTGEGKTLTATTALYLNALTGKGVHLVTVNDYLARRDAGWMGVIFDFLGVSTGVLISGTSYVFEKDYTAEDANDWRLSHLKQVTKKEAYAADITYGINSEFGFDYLRDNMTQSPSRLVQRNFYFVIVDEADSVLIDEARTPHIISAPYEQDTSKYYQYAKIIKRLNPETDYVIDEKLRTAHLSEDGIKKIEEMMGIQNIYEDDFETLYHLEAALKAQALYHNDKEYIVRDGEVVIVDEFTGRLLSGRRFSEGLHQAIEAKENVEIKQESRTLATVSLQNYFRMYEKIAGMTGTAVTEAEEFAKIYKAEVVVVPTHRGVQRDDAPDEIYKTTQAKYNAIAEDVAREHENGRPVLVGTTSIDKNELLSRLLTKKGVPHELLNAKNHEREAQIIAKAGERGAVTVATNMAGRGVDIVLGGMQPVESELSKEDYEEQMKIWEGKHDEILGLGGLYVVGTERHESRRIDNQLRGRSGRQGDQGKSKFFVSLEDDLMRIFGGDQISKLMTFFNLPEDQPLSHPMVSRAIEQAQVKVEGFNFDSRKRLVEYDDVLNRQRDILYDLRKKMLLLPEDNPEEFEKIVLGQIGDSIEQLATNYYAIKDSLVAEDPVEGDSSASEEEVQESTADVFVKDFEVLFPGELPQLRKKIVEEDAKQNEIEEYLKNKAKELFESRKAEVGQEVWFNVVRSLFLSTLDQNWTKHLTAIDDLREGINLRGYAQLDPLVEYKNEAFRMFESLITEITYEFTRRVLHIQIRKEETQQKQQQEPKSSLLETGVQYSAAGGAPEVSENSQAVSQSQKPSVTGALNISTSTLQKKKDTTVGYTFQSPSKKKKNKKKRRK